MTAGIESIRIDGVPSDTALHARVTRLVTASLARLSVGPVRGRVAFVDDNGPKGGPAMRCTLTVRVPYRPNIRVERRAGTPRLAFDAAFAVLDRLLERYRERDRDNRRHPKKYFAARRA